MAISQITDHEDLAQARLPEQFKGKVLITALLRAIAAEVQEYEDAVFPLLGLLDISTMIGAQLDGIGDILTEPRAGQSDADYRVALASKGARITASGTAEEVIQRFIALTSPSSPVVWTEAFPAGYEIFGDGSEPDGLLAAMEGASGVGIFVGLLAFLMTEAGDHINTEAGERIYITYESTGR